MAIGTFCGISAEVGNVPFLIYVEMDYDEMTDGLFQRKCKGFHSLRKFTDNLLPHPSSELLISTIWARALPKTCRSSGQGWGGL